MPRPVAEVTIVVDAAQGGRGVRLACRHLMNVGPSAATIAIDGRQLRADRTFRAVLPPLEPSKPHVVTARMQFEDGAVASAETVIEAAGPSEFVRTEVTPVAVMVGAHASDAAGCFTLAGERVRAVGPEKPPARVYFVRDPHPHAEVRALNPQLIRQNAVWAKQLEPLDAGTTIQTVWPIAKRFGGGADLFIKSVASCARKTQDFFGF